MTYALDHTQPEALRLSPDASSTPHQCPPARDLTDREAVIAAMVAGGRSCHDVALTLALPLQTVQAHLDQAVVALGFSSVEELSRVIFTGRGATSPPSTMMLAEATTGSPVNSLVVLDAAEAAVSADAERDSNAALRSELAATRTQLDQERETIRQLYQAVASRDTIGQAKGILMERHKISADGAFAALREESSHSHRKLVHVAEQLIFSGQEQASASTVPVLKAP